MPDTDPAKLAYEKFAAVYDEFCSANDYEMWFGELLPRLERLGLRRGALLDVACGTGRAFAPMLRRGWTITACDISPAMVAQARVKHGDEVRLEVADMREMPVYGSFSLVWALNDAVNYLLGDRDLVAALAAMAANLADDGLLVFDCNTRRLFREFFGARPEEPDDERWVWEGRGGEGDLYEARLSGEDIEPHLHRERHRSVAEVQEAMREVGLAPVAAIGQREEDHKVVLADDWDEDRDLKIIHVARYTL